MAARAIHQRDARVLSGAWLLAAIVAGCGKEGPPAPPLPRGPLPPREVGPRQIGAEISVGFEVPAARGTNPAQRPAEAELVRIAFEPGVQPPVDPASFQRRGEIVARVDLGPLATGARARLGDTTAGSLPGGGVGWTLRYAVRVRDRKSRPSPLVVAPDLVPIAPRPAPRALAAEPTGDGIRLRWEPPDDAGAGESAYNVYRAPAGKDWPERPLNREPIAADSYLDTTVETGAGYAYVVRVALASEPPLREGAPSEPVQVVAEDRFAPSSPAGLVVVQEGVAVRLFWDPNAERDLAGYRVWRSAGGGEWAALPDAPVEQSQYLDADVLVGQRLLYRVTALDRATPPNESEPSEEIEIDVRAEPAAPGGGGA